MTQPDSQTIDALDKLFNAWLTTNNIICKDGVLYKSTDMGDLLKSSDGSLQIVTPPEFNALIADPVKGLGHYAAENKINIIPIEQDFPE